MPTAIAALPQITPEVHALAARAGVTKYLIPVLEMTREVFPTAQLAVVHDVDPEIARDEHVRMEVDLTDIDDSDRLFDLQQRWNEALFRVCPATHVCVFRLRTL